MAVIAALAAVVAGCSGPEDRDGFGDDTTSAERLEAISQAARERDHSRIADLVRQLTSSDIAVRWAAIRTLRDLTGEDLGYRHDAPRAERLESVRRWVEAVDAGQFDAHKEGFSSRAVRSTEDDLATVPPPGG